MNQIYQITRRNGDKYEVILDEDFVVDRGIHLCKRANDKVVNGKDTMLHRWIMGVDDPKLVVDHINGNTPDNRKSNLRVATVAQNRQNVKHKGVHYRKKDDLWIATMHINGTHKFLGSSKQKEEAMKIYQKKHAEVYGEFSPWRETNE